MSLLFLRSATVSALRARHTGLRSLYPALRTFVTEAPPKTFQNDNQLPKLPIPDLHETADRYLRSLEPVLKDGEELDRAAQAVGTFIKPNGLGETLQKRLISLASNTKHSWLENIWLDKAYLEYREPLLLNVNWWCVFNNPAEGLAPAKKGTFSDLQIARASAIARRVLEFNDLLNKQELPVEQLRNVNLCMNQYKRVFGTARIADTTKDRLVYNYPATAQHIIVMAKDQFFKVQVLGEDGQPLSTKQINVQLSRVVDAVKDLSEPQPPVGILTSEHRDVWGKIRNELSQFPENASTLQDIDESLFVLCLDDIGPEGDADHAHHHIFHRNDAKNRWFDKPLQFIVANNGVAGVNGEHSPVDAAVPGGIFNYISSGNSNREELEANVSLPPPEQLRWSVTSNVTDAISAAESNAKKLIKNIQSLCLHYDGYGSDWIKNAKVSPDAYVQMALQLAYYRQYGECCPTYETASTRTFAFGRTETVRVCSSDSVAFVEAFDDNSIDDREKLILFKKAIESHLEYMKAASSGRGVDRHLLGLRSVIASEAEREAATIFSDPSYLKSMYFKLSTSNMSPGDHFYGGFGPVVPEGYGVNYAIGKNSMKFSISSWKNCKETDSDIFRDSLSTSLNDLRQAANQFVQS
ncbi:acyltransferase ChoActase/COT/CPT [Basidiobolus meristosporus CBS 931.73]|uniref:Acyltransferase ChoActase/COT/CPT n=1 Tax=Basidiobolus meristosporus CBS 931.73 TaxID=1314790 RepID=A0A1Y1WVB4_9FUNG|nr:acyltransferase ChoActase/COT/CPT [Basidiobolus meristosporus CBS 931.73]|eukprot:ORX77487.1 acyltransferase ChoActase/COT/CPT [Basidiobolus meristosporus CBS 931.73]